MYFNLIKLFSNSKCFLCRVRILIENFLAFADRATVIICGAASLENRKVVGCAGVGSLHRDGFLSVNIICDVKTLESHLIPFAAALRCWNKSVAGASTSKAFRLRSLSPTTLVTCKIDAILKRSMLFIELRLLYSDLSSNHLSTLHKDSFRALTHLTLLDLSKNHLDFLPNDLLLDLDSLSNLWVVAMTEIRC